MVAAVVVVAADVVVALANVVVVLAGEVVVVAHCAVDSQPFTLFPSQL